MYILVWSLYCLLQICRLYGGTQENMKRGWLEDVNVENDIAPSATEGNEEESVRGKP